MARTLADPASLGGWCYATAVRLACVLVLALPACSQVLGIEELAGPCTLDNGCGGGQVCDLTAPGGAQCISREGDIDGDGIPNAMDFCHHKMGGKFDEDQDGMGDECDPCPIARPPAKPDTDGDAVDSPCDPDPAEPGDQISAFDGFNAGIPVGWRIEGPWQPRGGEIVITPTDASTTFSLSAPVPLSTPHVAVLAQYRVDSVDGAATQARVGVMASDRRPAGITEISCGGSRAGGIDSVLLQTDTGASAQPLLDLFAPASLYRVAERIDGALGQCAMVADERGGAVQQGTSGESSSEGGLFVRGVTARFQYLLVIQRKP